MLNTAKFTKIKIATTSFEPSVKNKKQKNTDFSSPHWQVAVHSESQWHMQDHSFPLFEKKKKSKSKSVSCQSEGASGVSGRTTKWKINRVET